MTNKHEEMDYILSRIETFGFTKTFELDDYEEIDNPTFHKLRQSFLKAKERLNHYVVKHSSVKPESDL